MTAKVAANLEKAGGVETVEGWAALTKEDQETAREVGLRTGLGGGGGTCMPPRMGGPSVDYKSTSKLIETVEGPVGEDVRGGQGDRPRSEPEDQVGALARSTIMHKTGPFTNSGVSKFVKLVACIYTKHRWPATK